MARNALTAIKDLSTAGKAYEVLRPFTNEIGAIGDVASSAADGLRLSKSLASEAQMSEVGEILAGVGGRVPFRDAERVAQQYGGSPTDWVKKTSSSYTGRDGIQFETHWVENIKTSQRIEFKTKF